MIEIRPVEEDEFEEWQRAMHTGFLLGPAPTADQLEANRRHFGNSRSLGAFDGGRCVGTFRSFAQEVTAVGGAPVRSNAVTNVTVSPTHRRRGLLTEMMRRDLAAAEERGDALATLIAAEYPIYGRYGFGPATHATAWSVDVTRSGLDARPPVPADGARIDLVDGAEVRKLGPAFYEKLRPALPGFLDRSEVWWESRTGVLRFGGDWTEPYHAVLRSASGEVEGLVTYRCEVDSSLGEQPRYAVVVDGLLGATPAAEADLWRFLCSIDWVTRVKSGRRSPDDLLPHLLPDPRAARIERHSDWLWVRILDVAAALEARTYERTGALVLDVLDEGGPAGGRYRLEVSPEGASCTPAPGASADLTLPVAELATVWLGDGSLTRLAGLGRIREERTGAAREADALFRTSGRQWCPDVF
ncbi:GNAT family N-acetyltransferase [Streptomyces sp. DSM 110735]|uniref:GNAT family N-acetyltransferase n=1 Tax=Streptomyces sp. DSM 110735 TaxID=2775031 RepID=UPI0018F63657|nr:GNAT family N-acetyltransferase [Streptomyces sp. DSM 110735]MBJ7905940.1 GNAT family N-acetyltransferase [Streptomyces sp. DSM 110735]